VRAKFVPAATAGRRRADARQVQPTKAGAEYASQRFDFSPDAPLESFCETYEGQQRLYYESSALHIALKIKVRISHLDFLT